MRLGAAAALAALATLAAPAAAPAAAPTADQRPALQQIYRSEVIVTQNLLASQIGHDALLAGGGAVDAAIAAAFALAVVHPSAGNLGGGGFLLHRPADGEPVAYDFRETAPAAAHPQMWLVDGVYDRQLHQESHRSVGVPGTVAGLHLAWQDHGRLPWADLVAPAIALAQGGLRVTPGLAESLRRALPRLERHPASLAQFTRDGEPLAPGDRLVQPDLAATLALIAAHGPDGFYRGRTAELIVAEMTAHGGLITLADLAGYRAIRREPVRGDYRGHEVLSMPPPSSGGVVLVLMLNILEGYPLGELGLGTDRTLHLMAETMRRAYAERALHLGDPDHLAAMPLGRLIGKDHAARLRATIDPLRASVSRPDAFAWGEESPETTHLSVIDRDGGAVALTYTLEMGYGSGIVVPGAGFLLNNEMGDFNAVPGLTDTLGRIGTEPNLAAPGKRMLSSMTPTILVRDGRVAMVVGSLGGRTIINTVLQTILNVVDHGLQAQRAVDAPRIHHQWLPDRIQHEEDRFAPSVLLGLRERGHTLAPVAAQGVAPLIVVNTGRGWLEAGIDRRAADGGAAGR